MQIKSAQGDYEVKDVLRFSAPENALVLIDANVHHLYPHLGANARCCVIEANERSKSFHRISSALTFLQNSGARKNSAVYAIGGGTIQDIACFAASIYYRGIAWEFVPTTLLAQADSCIGAKCGINLNGYKNQIGTFHAPKVVWIDTNFLKTLPEEHILSGKGEMLKMAFLSGWTPEESETWTNAGSILQCLSVKKKIIEEDEYETGARKSLNYGHTFGHALEALYPVPHGRAIGWGMDIENWITLQYGYISRAKFETAREIIRKHMGKLKVPECPHKAELLRAVQQDKKLEKGMLTFWCPMGLVNLPFDEPYWLHLIEDYWKTEGVNELLHWD